MKELNGLIIQKSLKKVDNVTIPWIQQEFDLYYSEAKNFIRILIEKEWVEDSPELYDYPVIKDNLQLRKIAKKEINSLIKDITRDCISMFLLLQGRDDEGATERDLIMSVFDYDSATDTLDVLTKHRLIHLIGDRYYLSVSEKTIHVLSMVVKEKNMSYIKKSFSGDKTSNNSLRALFDILFEDK